MAAHYPVEFVDRALVPLRSHAGTLSQYLVPRDAVEQGLGDRLRVISIVVPGLDVDQATREEWIRRAAAQEYGRVAVSTYLHRTAP